MFAGLLTVRYLTSKDCFCSLSLSNFKHLQNGFVKLLYSDSERVHVSVGPSAIDDHSIGMSSLFAKALGIEENSLVAVSEIAKPPTIQSVTVSTQDANDHFVLESLAANVQSTLLGQISVLANEQKFIIWIGNSLFVTVSVCDIKPFSPGQIDNLTEVIIKPPDKQPKEMNENTRVKQLEDIRFKKASFDFLTEYMSTPENLILRLVPFKELPETVGTLRKSFNAFVSRSVFSQDLEDTVKNAQIFRMKLLLPDTEKSVHIRLFVFQDFLPDFNLSKICSENIFVSDTVMTYFNNCDIGTRVTLEHFNGQLPDVKEVEICTKKGSSPDVLLTFQQYLADNCREQYFVLNADVVEQFASDLRCFVRFQPCEVKFCVVNPDFVRNCKLVVIKENLPPIEVFDGDEFCLSKYTTKVANYDDIIHKCLFLFAYNTKVFSKMYNVLITGKPGTGKTTVLAIIKDHVNSFPYYIFTKTVNCKSIKGKTVDSLQKFFTTIFFDLIHRQPSVLILDDIHILCENVNEGEGLAQQTVYFNRVSEMLEGLFQSFCNNNAVGILATAESTSKLNKFIYATRGNHLFKNVYTVQQLSRPDRRKLFEFFFKNHDLHLDLEKCAEKTESFVMQDMVDLANKTSFESYQGDPDQVVLKIDQDHFDAALKTVTETSLGGVNLHPPGEKGLDHVGGLSDAKKILIETLLWPAKYPDLFANAPLRLASSVLLYGPPGTGKTLLVGAAAKHCGLRLISIKGPELLSKYIGASEQAVRDVFQRAQSAQPCILFFDEFDSLAPRRGHDNTGVTDRVVNQLLTQLDGIESLSGVFVLAATSRPDLLDPALLRPGRLDIHIRCPLPDEASRSEILQVLSKSLKFSSDVNLSEVARASDGFSGADLQAVLYSAQLESVKGLLLEDEASMQEFQVEEIHQARLMEALKSTRPSLTKAEQMKYEQIYRNFEGGGNKDFTPGSRATLA